MLVRPHIDFPTNGVSYQLIILDKTLIECFMRSSLVEKVMPC